MHRLRLALLSSIVSRSFVYKVHSWHINIQLSTVPGQRRGALCTSMSTASASEQTEQRGKDDDDDDNDADDEIIMLSGYPFYVKGPPPKYIEQVAAKVKATLEQVCGDQLVDICRMGSSAIDGIAGTPVCDMVAQLDPWPMSDVAKQRLAAAGGYECKGMAPHAPQDEWFFGGQGEPGHLGRVVLHTVPKDSPFVQEMQAFVDYVKSHPDAFERYNKAKVDGAKIMSQSLQQDGRLLGYKAQKANVCNAIRNEAMEWHNKKTNNG